MNKSRLKKHLLIRHDPCKYMAMLSDTPVECLQEKIKQIDQALSSNAITGGVRVKLSQHRTFLLDTVSRLTIGDTPRFIVEQRQRCEEAIAHG